MKITLTTPRDDPAFYPQPDEVIAQFQSPAVPRRDEYVHVGEVAYKVMEVEHVVTTDQPNFAYEALCTVVETGSSEIGGG